MKISSFPEGKYFGPNYFHNSNEKSGKPNFHDIMIITAFFPIKSKEYEGGRFIFDPSPLGGVAVGQKIEPIADRASAFTFGAENPHLVQKVESGIRLAFKCRNMQ